MPRTFLCGRLRMGARAPRRTTQEARRRSSEPAPRYCAGDCGRKALPRGASEAGRHREEGRGEAACSFAGCIVGTRENLLVRGWWARNGQSITASTFAPWSARRQSVPTVDDATSLAARRLVAVVRPGAAFRRQRTEKASSWRSPGGPTSLQDLGGPRNGVWSHVSALTALQ
jgi:hypothetical protein